MVLHSQSWIVISELQLAEHDVVTPIHLHVDTTSSDEITTDLSHIKIVVLLSQIEKNQFQPRLQTENDIHLHTITEYGDTM